MEDLQEIADQFERSKYAIYDEPWPSTQEKLQKIRQDFASSGPSLVGCREANP